MIHSKITAVRLLRQFRQVSEFIGGSLMELQETATDSERVAVATPVDKILGTIECDVLTPILAEHPMLRPAELLGKLRDKAKYRLMYCLGEGTPEEVIESNIVPDESWGVLEKHESLRPGIFWLELA